MYMYMYMYIYIHIYIHTYKQKYVYESCTRLRRSNTNVYGVCARVGVGVCVCVIGGCQSTTSSFMRQPRSNFRCRYTQTKTNTHTHTYVCMYVCMYVCICISCTLSFARKQIFLVQPDAPTQRMGQMMQQHKSQPVLTVTIGPTCNADPRDYSILQNNMPHHEHDDAPDKQHQLTYTGLLVFDYVDIRPPSRRICASPLRFVSPALPPLL